MVSGPLTPFNVNSFKLLRGMLRRWKCLFSN